MIGRLSPTGIRGRLLVATVLSVGAALVVLVIAFNLLFAVRLNANATDQAKARAQAELSVLTVSGGKLTIGEASDAAAGDQPVWVFSGSRAIEQPNAADATAGQTAAALAAAGREAADVPGKDIRLFALPVLDRGSRIGTVVAGASLAPYEDAQSDALVASFALAAVILALVAVITRWILGRALRPVASMTESAQAWSEHELDRRFAMGTPQDELTQLAATLDQLLDRIAESLRREQRLSAEISHELRTPLARITSAADLALRRERDPSEYRDALAAVVRNAGEMTRIMDSLLEAARVEAGGRRGRVDATDVARKAMKESADIAASRGVSMELDARADGSRVAADEQLVCRMLQPVVENACRYGRSSVAISIDRAGGTVTYTIRDDGPGVDADDVERIFEPGVRAQPGPGSGLGLPLARRLAESVGGVISARADDAGGVFTVELPADR
jgi:two-component system, OmpR family, sensor kinase